MDIGELSMATSQMNIGQEVNICLTQKAIENVNQTSEALTQMAQSIDPNLGNNIDVRA